MSVGNGLVIIYFGGLDSALGVQVCLFVSARASAPFALVGNQQQGGGGGLR